MIASFGCGIGDDFDISKLRYDKIILMPDAVVDGDHIAGLLASDIYKHALPLITEGKVYRAITINPSILSPTKHAPIIDIVIKVFSLIFNFLN